MTDPDDPDPDDPDRGRPLDPTSRESVLVITLALAAYAAYVVNAGQFLVKLRRARLERPNPAAASEAAT